MRFERGQQLVSSARGLNLIGRVLWGGGQEFPTSDAAFGGELWPVTCRTHDENFSGHGYPATT
jgi:hypothetical protein